MTKVCSPLFLYTSCQPMRTKAHEARERLCTGQKAVSFVQAADSVSLSVTLRAQAKEDTAKVQAAEHAIATIRQSLEGLNQVIGLTQKAMEICLQNPTHYHKESANVSIAGYFDVLISTLNRVDAAGCYLFSGTATRTPPVGSCDGLTEPDTNAPPYYQGNFECYPQNTNLKIVAGDVGVQNVIAGFQTLLQDPELSIATRTQAFSLLHAGFERIVNTLQIQGGLEQNRLELLIEQIQYNQETASKTLEDVESNDFAADFEQMNHNLHLAQVATSLIANQERAYRAAIERCLSILS